METSKLHIGFNKRFSPEFYKRIPESAGLLWILDSKRQLLILEACENIKEAVTYLRSSLSIETGRISQELVNEIHNINWVEAKNYEEAKQIKDTQKDKVPRYSNVLDTDFENFSFLSTRFEKSCIYFEYSNRKNPNCDNYGAFKGRINTQSVYSALIRLFWFQMTPVNSMNWPQQLTKLTINNKFILHITPGFSSIHLLNWKQNIVSFLNGDNNLLLTNALDLIAKSDVDAFTKKWLLKDVSVLERFYKNSSFKNKELRKKQGLKSNLLSTYWLEHLNLHLK